MQNFITYNIALTEDNTKVIDQINRLLLPNYKGAIQTPGPKESAENLKKTKAKNKPTASDDDDGDTIEFPVFKKAALACKKNFGEDFAKEVLEEAGVKVMSTLGRTVSKVDAELYADVMAAWTEGPSDEEGEEEEEDWDEEGEEEEEEELTADVVKDAAKAYSKENGRDEAKELLAKYKCKTLSQIGSLKPVQLKKLFAELV